MSNLKRHINKAMVECKSHASAQARRFVGQIGSSRHSNGSCQQQMSRCFSHDSGKQGRQQTLDAASQRRKSDYYTVNCTTADGIQIQGSMSDITNLAAVKLKSATKLQNQMAAQSTTSIPTATTTVINDKPNQAKIFFQTNKLNDNNANFPSDLNKQTQQDMRSQSDLCDFTDNSRQQGATSRFNCANNKNNNQTANQQQQQHFVRSNLSQNNFRYSSRRRRSARKCKVRFQPLPVSIDLPSVASHVLVNETATTSNVDPKSTKTHIISNNKFMHIKPLKSKLNNIKFTNIKLKTLNSLTSKLIQAGNDKIRSKKFLSSTLASSYGNEDGADVDNEDDEFGWGSDFDDQSSDSVSSIESTDNRNDATNNKIRQEGTSHKSYLFQVGRPSVDIRFVNDVIQDRGTSGHFKRIDLDRIAPVRIESCHQQQDSNESAQQEKSSCVKIQVNPSNHCQTNEADTVDSDSNVTSDFNVQSTDDEAELRSLEARQGYKLIKDKLETFVDKKLASFKQSLDSSSSSSNKVDEINEKHVPTSGGDIKDENSACNDDQHSHCSELSSSIESSGGNSCHSGSQDSGHSTHHSSSSSNYKSHCHHHDNNLHHYEEAREQNTESPINSGRNSGGGGNSPSRTLKEPPPSSPTSSRSNGSCGHVSDDSGNGTLCAAQTTHSASSSASPTSPYGSTPASYAGGDGSSDCYFQRIAIIEEDDEKHENHYSFIDLGDEDDRADNNQRRVNKLHHHPAVSQISIETNSSHINNNNTTGGQLTKSLIINNKLQQQTSEREAANNIIQQHPVRTVVISTEANNSSDKVSDFVGKITSLNNNKSRVGQANGTTIASSSNESGECCFITSNKQQFDDGQFVKNEKFDARKKEKDGSDKENYNERNFFVPSFNLNQTVQQKNNHKTSNSSANQIKQQLQQQQKQQEKQKLKAVLIKSEFNVNNKVNQHQAMFEELMFKLDCRKLRLKQQQLQEMNGGDVCVAQQASTNDSLNNTNSGDAEQQEQQKLSNNNVSIAEPIGANQSNQVAVALTKCSTDDNFAASCVTTNSNNNSAKEASKFEKLSNVDIEERRNRFCKNRSIIKSKLQSMLECRVELKAQTSLSSHSNATIATNNATTAPLLSSTSVIGGECAQMVHNEQYRDQLRHDLSKQVQNMELIEAACKKQSQMQHNHHQLTGKKAQQLDLETKQRLLEQQRQMSLKLKQKPRRKSTALLRLYENENNKLQNYNDTPNNNNDGNEYASSKNFHLPISGQFDRKSSARRSLAKRQVSMICLSDSHYKRLQLLDQSALVCGDSLLAKNRLSDSAADQPTDRQLKGALSLRQLVEDVIDDCERSEQLSALTMGILSSSDSFSSDMALSADDLASSSAHRHHQYHRGCSSAKSSESNLNKSAASSLESLSKYDSAKSKIKKKVTRTTTNQESACHSNSARYHTHAVPSTKKANGLNQTGEQQFGASQTRHLSMMDRRSISNGSEIGSELDFEKSKNERFDAVSNASSSQSQRNKFALKTCLKNFKEFSQTKLSKLSVARKGADFINGNAAGGSKKTNRYTREEDIGFQLNGIQELKTAGMMHGTQRLRKVNNSKQSGKEMHYQSFATNQFHHSSSDGIANHFVTISNRKWKSCHLRANLKQSLAAFASGLNHQHDERQQKQTTAVRLHNDNCFNKNVQQTTRNGPRRVAQFKDKNLSYLDNLDNFTGDDSCSGSDQQQLASECSNCNAEINYDCNAATGSSSGGELGYIGVRVECHQSSQQFLQFLPESTNGVLPTTVGTYQKSSASNRTLLSDQ